MSDEPVIGHVNWSPDFKSPPPDHIKKMLDRGEIKLEPKYSGGRLDSINLVVGDEYVEVSSQAESAELGSRQVSHPITLIGSPGASHEVTFTYTNWKGKTSVQRALFTSLQVGSTEFHPEPQLLVYGYDLDKKALRTYAIKDITNLRVSNTQS